METNTPLLSELELKVLLLVCDEYISDEIAFVLGVSKITISRHRRRIMEKINAKTIAGMVMYAYTHKLIDVPISRYRRKSVPTMG